MLPVYVNIACVYILCVLYMFIVIHVNCVHFAMFGSFITWQDVCCICTVGELCNKMDIEPDDVCFVI